MRRYLFTDKAPTPGFYSQAVCVNPGDCTLVFLAGQTGNLPKVEDKEEPVVSGGLGPQTTQALKNILAVVEAAGGGVNDIVELKVFLKDSVMNSQSKPSARTAQREMFNSAYVEFFTQHKRTKEAGNLPARTMMWVAEVPLEFPTEDTLVEITAVAAIPRR